MSAIQRLGDPTSVDQGGGKWLGLTRLCALRAPVPPAFCIGADAFRSVANAVDLPGLVAELDAAEGGAQMDLARDIRERIEGATLAPGLLSEIRAAYAELGAIPVAVRSSATAEDLADASFAGQYDTLLDVRGEDELFAAIKTCWASAFADRAVAYRRGAGVSNLDVAMAVVVQELVKATISGVTFTRHPTEERPVMLFEACRGLGEALVSGSVDPDRFEVDRVGERVEELANAAGTRLDAARLLAMRDLFLQLETQLAFPADLEWSWQGDALFILQARPITTGGRGAASVVHATTEDGALQGAAASPGVSDGPARVLLDPDEDELDPGDVLVTAFTDPSFMRHFRIACALVMEHGGMLSHGAIVARECGIPAVIGVESATTRIANGSEIRVDGNRGVVTPLSAHSRPGPGYADAAMSDLLPQLQSLRLKGRANPEVLAAAWALSEEDARQRLARLAEDGLVDEKKGFYGLSAEGERQRTAALAREREQLDLPSIAALYDEFCGINGDFKQLVTDVQLGKLEKSAAPGQLRALHERFAPIATRIGTALARLAPYAGRFESALSSLAAGDDRYLASPMVDSYHTLWFELHEELIQALDRSRVDEAAAGRA
jgi:pyruvate,water dikinase